MFNICFDTQTIRMDHVKYTSTGDQTSDQCINRFRLCTFVKISFIENSHSRFTNKVYDLTSAWTLITGPHKCIKNLSFTRFRNDVSKFYTYRPRNWTPTVWNIHNDLRTTALAFSIRFTRCHINVSSFHLGKGDRLAVFATSLVNFPSPQRRLVYTRRIVNTRIKRN